MPYIKEDKRHQLDSTIDELHRVLVNMKLDDETTNTEGSINYTITRLLMLVYGDKDTTRYSQVNDAIGVLECCKLELYRQVAAPYEEQKKFENGAVDISYTPEVVGEITAEIDDSTT